MSYNNEELLSIISVQEEKIIEQENVIDCLRKDVYHLLNEIGHIRSNLPKPVKELIRLKWEAEKLQRSLELS